MCRHGRSRRTDAAHLYLGASAVALSASAADLDLTRPAEQAKQPQEVTMNAIEIEGLSKRFGAVRAVEAVRLAVEPGEIFGLMATTAPARRRWCACCSG